ncbi:hypothetical protein [Larkinella soli]|uniref:hypothetical protein n=1 Tax=Larkinella soli TaxID=1770527 RepID=UPI0013E2BDD5|nr:hypothetical protein [Larkinella soli]
MWCQFAGKASAASESGFRPGRKGRLSGSGQAERAKPDTGRVWKGYKKWLTPKAAAGWK